MLEEAEQDFYARAYALGQEARRTGRPLHSNPYPEGSITRAGWIDGRAHVDWRDRALNGETQEDSNG